MPSSAVRPPVERIDVRDYRLLFSLFGLSGEAERRVWRGWSSSSRAALLIKARGEETNNDTSKLAPKIIKRGNKNGEMDRNVELDEQGSTGKLLCGRLGRV